jgi:hypothetical protein
MVYATQYLFYSTILWSTPHSIYFTIPFYGLRHTVSVLNHHSLFYSTQFSVLLLHFLFCSTVLWSFPPFSFFLYHFMAFATQYLFYSTVLCSTPQYLFYSTVLCSTPPLLVLNNRSLVWSTNLCFLLPFYGLLHNIYFIPPFSVLLHRFLSDQPFSDQFH